MRYAKVVKLLLTALSLAVFTTACADGPMAPEMGDVELTAAFGKGDKGGPPKDGGGSDGGTTANLTNVQWITPLAQDITVSQLCETNKQCSLHIPEVNTYLTVPVGALTDPTVITMTALAGTDVNFVFGPHGMQFNEPVKIKVDQTNTSVSGKVDIWVNYWVDDPSNVVETFGGKVFRGHILFETTHFSGYAIAM